MTWRSWLVFGLASLTIGLSGGTATAQLAPVGAHHAARASDTGHAGMVNSSGGYGSSVPLDLPPARGGLPIPVQLVYGGRGIGAAGLGWDVPLSFIARDTTLARRRPGDASNVAPQPREQVSLALDGRRLELVKAGTDWVARRDAPDLIVREQVDGSWVAFDGHGRTYRFAETSFRLAGANVWLLAEISGPGGSRVRLDYNIRSGGRLQSLAVAVDLVGVSYNPHPTTEGCFKNTVSLAYDASAALMSLTTLGNKLLVREHRLATVDISARESCSGPGERLRRYEFGYETDPDTRHPRLASVHVLGRASSPEGHTPLPVARYTYGAASLGGSLNYQQVTGGNMGVNLGRMVRDTSQLPAFGEGFTARELLMDMTGDGRPDLLAQSAAGMTIKRNMSGPGIAFGEVATLSDSVLTSRAFELRTSKETRVPNVSGGVVKHDMVWRQALDVNGDGRIDVIDASEQAGHWVVYLNTPDPAAPRTPRWARRLVSISALAQHLRSRGHTIDASFLPLTRRATMDAVLVGTGSICWFYNGFEWVEDPLGFQTGMCRGIPAPPGERTITEWELSDVNGDGYADVMLNSSAAGVISHTIDQRLPDPPDGPLRWAITTTFAMLELQAGQANKIEAVFNVVGARVATGPTSPFSSPVTLQSGAACGVSRWEHDPQRQLAMCGMLDVNADGVADRVDGTSVYLGTGTQGPGGYFTIVPMLALPGALAIHQDNRNAVCAGGGGIQQFQISQVAGLRDLTGDGVPDYVAKTGTQWNVSVGTGVGFASAMPITGVQFALSSQSTQCNGESSTTQQGLFDVDGDGKADLVSGGVVYSLVGASGVPGNPDAGRMIEIDNGHGARTKIRYRSIKEEDGTLHQVPFAEIVVDSVETIGMQGFGGTLAATRYAYGGAELVFDPALDGFRFPGYRRQIVVPPSVGQPAGVGTVSITDAYAQLSAVNPYGFSGASTETAVERYARRTRIGKISDVTVLSGNFGAALATPSALLGIDVYSDARRIAGTHYEWDARLLATRSSPGGPEPCSETVFPYDVTGSAAFDAGHDQYDPCTARGFAFGSSVQSWRGEPGAAPPATANVEVRSEVREVDQLGRVLVAAQLNDLHRADDDLCITTTYAEPTGSSERQLHAPATHKVTNCVSSGAGAVTLAGGRWEYDHLPVGSISSGFPTSYTLERRDDAGALLTTIRQFDATFDALGNPVTVTSTREDGATRTATTDYDPFRLAPTGILTTATGVPPMQTTITRDPLTLIVRSVTAPTGEQHGTIVDGFDRVVLSTQTPIGGAEGAMSFTRYLGFAGGDSSGRRVEQKVFTDPVAVDPDVARAASGRTATAFLDELGRSRRTVIALGASYDEQLLIAGHRVYDTLGRVVFEADPYPSNQSFATAYGTTAFFNADGTPKCIVRANGQRSQLATATDEGPEVYPTCFQRNYEDHTEVFRARSADSLLAGSPQAGVEKTSYTTAIGRLLARSTFQGGSRLEHATFAHDRLGHLTGMTRYQDPQAGTKPVTSSWRYDSLGQVLQLDEPDAVPQFNTYSNWGELLAVVRILESSEGGPIEGGGIGGGPPPPSGDPGQSGLRVLTTYDALGRTIHSEEQRDGVIDPETVKDYFYDQGVNVAPQLTPAHTLGRLTLATSPTGSASFSYDGLGRMAARVFTDNVGGLYVEKHAYNGDGSPSALELLLPDTGYLPERVQYGYDSAGRGESVRYTHASEALDLFQASTIDPFGRVREAHYGEATFVADYADVGRRLLNQVSIASAHGARTITFEGYDPVGRERSRLEVKQGDAIGTRTATTTSVYDALGRLSSARQTAGGATVFDQQFTYDPLGNILGIVGSSVDPTTLTYSQTDRDRICRIRYGADSGTDCNVTYDELGGIVTQATPTGQRQYSYLVDGSVRTVSDERGTQARYRYGAFGEVQELELTSSFSTDDRIDRHYGSLITRRETPSETYLVRRIPGPDGFVATRRGAGGPWVFAFGEARGNRFFTDETGAFVQDVDYDPYGKPSSTGAEPGARLYSNEQWNGGDLLAPLGISQLGARLYDPAIGRFLSRDPLLIPRTATTTNPYAFAMSDPVNGSDRTGLDPCSHSSNTTDMGVCQDEGGRGDLNSSHWTSIGFGYGGGGGWSSAGSIDFSFPLPTRVHGPYYNGPGGGGGGGPSSPPSSPPASPITQADIDRATAALRAVGQTALRLEASAPDGWWQTLCASMVYDPQTGRPLGVVRNEIGEIGLKYTLIAIGGVLAIQIIGALDLAILGGLGALGQQAIEGSGKAPRISPFNPADGRKNCVRCVTSLIDAVENRSFVLPADRYPLTADSWFTTRARVLEYIGEQTGVSFGPVSSALGKPGDYVVFNSMINQNPSHVLWARVRGDGTSYFYDPQLGRKVPASSVGSFLAHLIISP
jgi:RHS repeat-associated protein